MCLSFIGKPPGVSRALADPTITQNSKLNTQNSKLSTLNSQLSTLNS
jgi:hypothetical protein